MPRLIETPTSLANLPEVRATIVAEVNVEVHAAPADHLLPSPLGTSDGAPVGARLALYHLRWRALFPHSAWLLQLIFEGLHLAFDCPPPLTGGPFNYHGTQ